MRPATATILAAMTRALGASAVAASWLLAGCAGNGAGLDANGQPLTAGGGGNAPLTADFNSIQAQVFTPICTVCHAGAGAPQGLRLDATNSYDLLVGVASVEVPSLFRVKPGDPDNSYIVQKLEGHAAVGARMPFGGPYLSSDVTAVIRQWITDGALRPSGNAQPASFAMVAVAPAANEVLTHAPPQILISFNHDLDVTRIDAESVRMERRVAGGIDVRMQVVPARVAVSSDNPRALLLWPLHSLADGHYRVVMRIAAPWGLTDIAGEVLHPAGQNMILMNESADAVITVFDVEAAP